MRKLFQTPAMIAAIAAAALAVAVVPASGEPHGAASAAKRVSIKDNFFSPRSISVRRGGKVTWTRRGSNPHNVTFTKVPRGASRRGSSTKTSGRFTRSFSKRGTYRYVCTIHSGMRGSVTAK